MKLGDFEMRIAYGFSRMPDGRYDVRVVANGRATGIHEILILASGAGDTPVDAMKDGMRKLKDLAEDLPEHLDAILDDMEKRGDDLVEMVDEGLAAVSRPVAEA